MCLRGTAGSPRNVLRFYCKLCFFLLLTVQRRDWVGYLKSDKCIRHFFGAGKAQMAHTRKIANHPYSPTKQVTTARTCMFFTCISNSFF